MNILIEFYQEYNEHQYELRNLIGDSNWLHQIIGREI